MSVYFDKYPNIHVDADGYLKGAGGLSWFPSDDAKVTVALYENVVVSLVRQMARWYTGHWILSEIKLAREKKVVIMPPEFAPDRFFDSPFNVPGFNPRTTRNSTTGLEDEDDYRYATKPGTQWNPKNGCQPPEYVKQKDLALGGGADTIISFDPALAWNYGPGGAPDEVLLHELVHAMRFVRGQASRCRFDTPKGYAGDYEEFVAVVLANVYISETNRTLRRDHDAYVPLPAGLSTSQAFYAQYRGQLANLKGEHPQLYNALKQATGIRFNPFTLI